MANKIVQELEQLLKNWGGCPSCGARRTAGNDKIIYCASPFCMRIFWHYEDGWIPELQGYIKESDDDQSD